MQGTKSQKKLLTLHNLNRKHRFIGSGHFTDNASKRERWHIRKAEENVNKKN